MPSKHDSPSTRKGTIAGRRQRQRDLKAEKYPRDDFPSKGKSDEYSLAWTKAYLNPQPETQIKKAGSIKITGLFPYDAMYPVFLSIGTGDSRGGWLKPSDSLPEKEWAKKDDSERQGWLDNACQSWVNNFVECGWNIPE